MGAEAVLTSTHIELPQQGSSNEYPQSMFSVEIWRISEFFIWKFSFFGGKIFSIFEQACFHVFQQKNIDIFLISSQKHMLWVLIRSASWRHFYCVPTTHIGGEIRKIFTFNTTSYLELCKAGLKIIVHQNPISTNVKESISDSINYSGINPTLSQHHGDRYVLVLCHGLGNSHCQSRVGELYVQSWTLRKNRK